MNYTVDFYADHNGNGIYDAPPTDHAWREQITASSGDETIAFTHNTTFTDINWAYQTTLTFTGMTPHVGQAFFLRLVNTGMLEEELGQQMIPSIPAPDFSVLIPGLKPGNTYHIDYFADLNGNLEYDLPPTDHAWRDTVVAGAGDTTLSFAHNTNFTDIAWDLTTDIAATEEAGIIRDIRLAQNYPNPFNPVTTIEFSIPTMTHVELTVFNMLGQRIRTLVNGELVAGLYNAIWDGRNEAGVPAASGIYLYRFKTGDNVRARKLVLLK